MVKMIKIVINACYGGFNLSNEAEKWLIENKNWNKDKSKWKYDRKNPDSPSPLRRDPRYRAAFISNLKIIEIPDDIEYDIKEHAGKEWVAEKHRTWGFEFY